MNDKWLLNEFSNEKIVKIFESIVDFNSKSNSKLKYYLDNELAKYTKTEINTDILINEFKERGELIKNYYKKLTNFIIFSSNRANSVMKDKLPKISNTNKNIVNVNKYINNFLHSNITIDHEKESIISPKLKTENRIFNIISNSQRIHLNKKDINSSSISLAKNNYYDHNISLIKSEYYSKPLIAPISILENQAIVNKRF